jgi:hypothetical protein
MIVLFTRLFKSLHKMQFRLAENLCNEKQSEMGKPPLAISAEQIIRNFAIQQRYNMKSILYRCDEPF